MDARRTAAAGTVTTIRGSTIVLHAILTMRCVASLGEIQGMTIAANHATIHEEIPAQSLEENREESPAETFAGSLAVSLVVSLVVSPVTSLAESFAENHEGTCGMTPEPKAVVENATFDTIFDLSCDQLPVNVHTHLRSIFTEVSGGVVALLCTRTKKCCQRLNTADSDSVGPVVAECHS